MGVRITREAANVAAKWWGEKLRKFAPHDNGDQNTTSLFAGILADMMATPECEENVNRFIDMLSDAIMAKDKDTINLDCDYAPCRILQEVAKDAGINQSNFPWKTNMIISGNKVLVSDGYGRPYERIF